VAIATVGQNISPNLQIKSIYLREPNNTLQYAGISTIGEGVPVHSVTTRGPNTFDTVAAKLVIEFTIPNAKDVAGAYVDGLGASAIVRTADVVVAITQTTHNVAFCYTSQPILAAH